MNKQELVKDLTSQLLDQLGFEAEITVEEDEENEAVKVNLEVEDPGHLIGFHGKTLSAMQLILGLMLFHQLGEWQRVLIDINDYRQEQKDRLQKIAMNAAQRAKMSGQPVALSPMTPFERRIIHITLSDDSAVETESSGESPRRYVVISPVSEE